MLQRVAALSVQRGLAAARGVLAKGPKPGQELRVDMPAIGPRTIEWAACARLAGVVVETGAVLVLDRGEAIRAADAAGCAVHGLEPGAIRPQRKVGAAIGRVIGRLRPSRRDATDIETGLAAVEALAPFATGASAVVVRRYVLAIEAAEGIMATLERAATLRQWGLRWHKVGALVRRAEEPKLESSVLEALLTQAAMQGLAGIAVTGRADALAPYEEAALRADNHGLFLVLCEV
jgi:DUF1009 family protein